MNLKLGVGGFLSRQLSGEIYRNLPSKNHDEVARLMIFGFKISPEYFLEHFLPGKPLQTWTTWMKQSYLKQGAERSLIFLTQMTRLMATRRLATPETTIPKSSFIFVRFADIGKSQDLTLSAELGLWLGRSDMASLAAGLDSTSFPKEFIVLMTTFSKQFKLDPVESAKTFKFNFNIRFCLDCCINHVSTDLMMWPVRRRHIVIAFNASDEEVTKNPEAVFNRFTRFFVGYCRKCVVCQGFKLEITVLKVALWTVVFSVWQF